MANRNLHHQIRANIEHALDGRTWSWLAEKSGVPASTLSNQRSRPCFSLEVLSKVAEALGTDLVGLLSEERSSPKA